MERRSFLKAGIVGAAACASGLVATAQTSAVVTAPAKAAAGLLTRPIPASGEQLPVIGLGTSGPFEVGADAAARAPLREVLAEFFAAGATVIDTSPMYSTAEGVLGELLTPVMQQRAFIATKVWTRGATEGVAQMRRSMALLRRDRIDLMQVHNLLELDAHLRTLRRWKAEGLIRYIGITHFTVESHEELARVIERERPDFVQFNYSASTRAAESRLLPLCADQGVAVLVNRAFDDGRIFQRVQGKPLPAWAPSIGCTSWAQLLLKFVIAHPAVTCVIPATGKLRNLRDNLAAGRGPLPDEAQRREIAAAVAG